jgi:hypothetical protein
MNRSENLDVNEDVTFSVSGFPFHALVTNVDEAYAQVTIQDNGGVIYTSLVDAVSAEADAKLALFRLYRDNLAAVEV